MISGILLLATINGEPQIVFHYPPSSSPSSHIVPSTGSSVANPTSPSSPCSYNEDIFLLDSEVEASDSSDTSLVDSDGNAPVKRPLSEAEREYGFDLARDYDINNTLLNVEQFGNDLFIESILNDDYSLSKLKYKVSAECSARLAEASIQQAHTGRVSHHRFNKDKGKKRKKQIMQRSGKQTSVVPSMRKEDTPKKDENYALASNPSHRVNILKERLATVFSFETDRLCELLAQPPSLYYLEVKIDSFCFLGLPRATHVEMQRPPRRKRRPLHIKGKARDLEVSEVEYFSPGMMSEHSDYLRQHDTEKTESGVSLFSVVIVTNLLGSEYQQKRLELRDNILGKITTILEDQQRKEQYVEKEVRAIVAAKTNFMEKLHLKGQYVSSADSTTSTELDRSLHDGIETVDLHLTVKSYYERILEALSLARALLECYEHLLSSQIFKLQINGITFSFNVPIKKNFLLLPHPSIRLNGSGQDPEAVFREMLLKNRGQQIFGLSRQVKTQNVHYIGLLLDESFFRNSIFPSVTNLLKIKSYYYLNNFQSAGMAYNPGDEDNITRIFRSCLYEKYSLLIIDDLNDIVDELDPHLAKDFKAFIERINATKPLKKIIRELYDELDLKQAGNHEKGRTKLGKYISSGGTEKKPKKPEKKPSLLADHPSEAYRENVVINMIYHLIYWEKVKFVLPITKNTKFVISPLANIGTVNEEVKSEAEMAHEYARKFDPKEFDQLDPVTYSKWIKGINREFIEEFRIQFPNLPPLPEFLSYFNSPRSYYSLNHENAVATVHLDACCWLMKKGLIVQYFNFGWFVLTSNVKMQVFEELKITRGNSDGDGTPHPELLSMRDKRNLSRSESGALKQGSEFSMGSVGLEENSVILKPSGPKKFESKCIEKILQTKKKETATILYKILKYLDGKTPFEVILLKENIKRADFYAAIKDLGEHIITYSHW